MPYRLSPLAERDLDEIWSYVAEDATPTTADRLVDDIIHRFDLLAEQPGMGRARPEFGIGVRSSAVENYVIRQEGNDVLIARVLHGRRDQITAWSASSLRFQASPNRRRKSARSGWNAGGRPERPHTKRQRFFRPVSRRKTAAFDLTTLWCCAVGTTFQRWLDLRRRN
jgi:toxin ParE1/3/4